jgi:hypothetical protein
MTSEDIYTEWDAAYVLGSLSATERREYERHLAECDACSAAVAELAGMPGLLAKVPVTEAIDLLDTAPAIPLPPTLLPRMVRSARRRQRRMRGYIAGGLVAAAAAAAALVLAVPLVSTPAPAPTSSAMPAAQLVSLDQVVPNPLSASAHLVAESWGTSIEMNCHYGAQTSSSYPGWSAGGAVDYAMFVTDASGTATQVATWSATPGSTVEPSGTTSLAVGQIRSIDVRSTSTGTVLLAGTP